VLLEFYSFVSSRGTSFDLVGFRSVPGYGSRSPSPKVELSSYLEDTPHRVSCYDIISSDDIKDLHRVVDRQ
jgi:hypothetical protein